MQKFWGDDILNDDSMIPSTTAPEVAEVIQEQVDKASSFLTEVKNYFLGILPLLAIALIILAVGILLSRLISKIVMQTMKRSNIDDAARNFIVSFIRIVLYVVVIIMALSVLNVPMSSVITVLGAAGLAVSLALQTCLTNLCGGFIILFSKPFIAGDTVEIGGTVGIVQTIGILYTKLQTFDGKSVLVPNGKVTESKLINYTETPTRRVDMTFEISYESDFNKARQLILSAVSESPMILQDTPPVVRMSGHRESAIAIDVLVWVENDNYMEVKYMLNETVKRLFDKGGIEIPFSQLDVHLHK